MHDETTFDGVGRVTARSAKDKATLFNEYFSSVFRPPTTCTKSNTRCELPRSLKIEELSNITLAVEEFTQNLSNLDTSKALLALMTFQLVFCKNAASKLHPVFVIYSITHCILVRSRLNGNLPMLRLSTRKIVKKVLKIIDLSLASHPWKSSGA